MAVQPFWKPPWMVIHNSRKQVNLLFNGFHCQAVSLYLAHFPSKSHCWGLSIYDICQSSSAAILKMRPFWKWSILVQEGMMQRQFGNNNAGTAMWVAFHWQVLSLLLFPWLSPFSAEVTMYWHLTIISLCFQMDWLSPRLWKPNLNLIRLIWRLTPWWWVQQISRVFFLHLLHPQVNGLLSCFKL